MGTNKPPKPIASKQGIRSKAGTPGKSTPTLRKTTKPAAPAKPRKRTTGNRSEVKDAHDRYAEIETG